MGFHPHIHAIVPGGGPALDGRRWVAARHPTQANRRKPYLTDNIQLGRVFRQKFTDGFRRLARANKLKLQDGWAKLQDRQELESWLDAVAACDWNVFIEGPPHSQSRPEHVLKYLARYLTGGPISDRRIMGDEQKRVTFWARSKDKSHGHRSRPFRLSGKEFVRRWAMHILPKGYTRSRCFGGYHGRQRAAYLADCRALLANLSPAQPGSGAPPSAPPIREPSPLTCPRCSTPLRCLDRQRRPSWKRIFTRSIYGDAALYSPAHHIYSRGPPAFPLDG
ncbi:MAG: transposase [Phycisphaerae bacterium]